MVVEVSSYVKTVQWCNWMLGICFKGFRAFSFGDAARTRSVAKRSQKERIVVSRHVTTRMVPGLKWS